MKASCTFVASVLAASTAALASPCCDNESNHSRCSIEGQSYSRYSTPEEHGMTDSQKNLSSSNVKKFAPRFDGLRFIETLITAHR